MKIRKLLKDTIVDVDFVDMYEIEDIILNWPEITGENGHKEPLSLENWSILSLTDNQLIMCAGGDWQESKKLTIYFDVQSGKLIVTNIEDGYEEGLTEEEILKLLE